jgi:hypothetical protein
MPSGHPDPDASATGFDAAHRSELKRTADGISRSISEVFAFLTHSGDAGKLGKCDILSVLPDKFARFLCEFHNFRFSSLDLPQLTADRSDLDVHGAIDSCRRTAVSVRL